MSRLSDKNECALQFVTLALTELFPQLPLKSFDLSDAKISRRYDILYALRKNRKVDCIKAIRTFANEKIAAYNPVPPYAMPPDFAFTKLVTTMQNAIDELNRSAQPRCGLVEAKAIADVLFYNYPPGESSYSAEFMDTAASIAAQSKSFEDEKPEVCECGDPNCPFPTRRM